MAAAKEDSNTNLAQIIDFMQQYNDIYRYAFGYDKQGTSVLTLIATINGVHYFKVRPPIGTDIMMTIEREPENIYDSNAIKVKMPLKLKCPH